MISNKSIMRNTLIFLALFSGLYFSQSTTFSSSGIHISGTNADKPTGVFAADLDGDGDQDIVSASSGDNKISWYENDGTADPSFTFHNITASAYEAIAVFAIDVDSDGDMDILSAARNTGINWFENDGSADPGFTPRSIESSNKSHSSVFAIDFDRDGDIDVLSASNGDDNVAWYENNGSQTFTKHSISTNTDGARDVFAIDVDSDGDIDVLAAARNANQIYWFENNGSQSFTRLTITTTPPQTPNAVYAIDLDQDGDIDILSASEDDDKIMWYENIGNQSFETYTITTSAIDAYDVYAADMDNDGDLDILSANYSGRNAVWYENNGSQSFTYRNIANSQEVANDAWSIYAKDLDNDGDLDVITAFANNNKVVWYENNLAAPGTPTFKISGANIESTLNNASVVYAADIDADGDIDVLSGQDHTAGANDKIKWIENNGAADPVWTNFHTITSNANGIRSIYTIDLDRDGDLDVLSASLDDNTVAWFESDGASSPSFTKRTISSSVDNAESAYAIDIDHDGDIDVVTAGRSSGVDLYKNNGSQSFTAQSIDTDYKNSVYALDLDGDGDNDIIASSRSDDKVVWYENNYPTNSFTGRVITSSASGVQDIFPIDLDRDGDIDIVSAYNFLEWYENDGASDPSFTTRTLATAASGDATGTVSVFAIDMDNDGDVDLLTASPVIDSIIWYQNNGSQSFTRHVIYSSSDGAQSAYAIDVDSDGDIDVLTASANDNNIEWYESSFSNDNTAPTISSVSINLINTYVDVTFSEAVYNTNGGSGALEAPDFALSISGGDATVAEYPNSISANGNVYTLGLNLSGTPNGSETLTVSPQTNAIYDAAGNAASTSQSNNTVSLYDSRAPRISSVTLAADNSTLTVTMTDAVYTDLAYITSTFAGSAGSAGSSNGTGTNAKFHLPYDVAYGNDGIYVVDGNNHMIRRIYFSPEGLVTLIAGNGSTGEQNGTGNQARFNNPQSLVYSNNNIYVSDLMNNRIRKVTPQGVVTTFAGGTKGDGDGTGTNARFSGPIGIANDSNGNLYVADTGNHTIRKITTGGVVTTFAGITGSHGFTNGAADQAQFYHPIGIAVDSNDNVYVVDTNNAAIRKITPEGVVTTLASNGVNGVQFGSPRYIDVDSQGNLYISDTSWHTIRKITPDGVLTTIAGTSESFGTTDGVGTSAKFQNPHGIAIDRNDNIYIADTNNNTIRKMIYGGNGELVASDFAFSISGGTATLSSATPSSISASGNVYTLGISLSGTPNGSETITVNPVDNGIYDASGDEASTTQNNNSVKLNEKIVPTISSVSLAADNSSLAVTFSESVYNTNGGSGALEVSDFVLSVTGGVATFSGGATSNYTPTTISNSGNIYTLGISLSGIPNGNETVNVNPAAADAIFDANGNAASTTQSNNSIKLNDKDLPIISSVFLAPDNSTLAVTFSEAVYNASGGSGALETSDFAFSISGGAASLSSTTPSSISVSGNVYTLGISISGTPNGNETLTVNPVDDSIYDATGNEASTSQSNNTVTLKVIGQYTATDLSVIGDAISVGKLDITDTGTIQDLNVEMTIDMQDQSAFQYINISLLSPAGTPVKLIKYNTLSNDTYETILDDEASTHIKDGSAPYADKFIPENPLSYFDGESIKGKWELVVSNKQGITGTISWVLNFSSDLSTPLPVPNYGTEYAGDQLSVVGDAISVSKMTISDDITITDLNLKFSFDMNNGSAYEYIKVTLKSDQITYYPFTENQFIGDMYRTILDDEAIKTKATSNDWTAPFIGAHQSPNNPLNSFDGLKANTEWQLLVTNNQGNTGTVNWSLLVNSNLTSPTVALTSTESTNTGNSPIPITATFSEYVSGFDSSDVEITNGSVSSFSGSGKTYTFSVKPVASGTVTIMVPENVAVNKALYGNMRVANDSLTFQYTKPIETFYVTKTGNDSNDGSLSKPLLTISKAVTLAASKDSIIVYPGLYEEAVDYNKKNILIASRYLSTNDTTYRDSTVIQGKVTMESLDSTAALIGFMIYKDQVHVKGGNPILKRLHIRENSTGSGLLIDNNAKLVINDLVIKRNIKENEGGGGIYITKSNVILNNAIIDSNSSTSTNDGYGGGFYSSRSHITINNSQFNDNYAGRAGGGIATIDDSSFTMNNVTVKRDSTGDSGGGLILARTLTRVVLNNVLVDSNISMGGVQGSGGIGGGGIGTENVSLYITNSIISNNLSLSPYGGGYGGGLHYETSLGEQHQDSLIVENTSFINNRSYKNGGGANVLIENYGYATFSNVLFAKNKAGYSTFDQTSGLHFNGSNMTSIRVINNTFVGNEGNRPLWTNTEGIIINTIVWHNSPSVSSIIGGEVAFSNIEGYQLNSDPGFVDLANGDYRLSDSSPSLGTGTSEYEFQIYSHQPKIYLEVPTTDINGSPRPNPAGSNPDMGAYESSKSTRVTDTYYVMKSGNDQNNGSLTSPFLTIQRGIDAGYHGDTVIVYPGKYVEDIDYKEKNIALASRYLTTNDSTYRDNTVIQGKVTMESLDSRAALIGFMIYKNRIKIYYGSPVLKRIHIREYNGRGALYFNTTDLVTVDHIEVKNNHLQVSESQGGAVTILSSKVILNNAVIDSNINTYNIGSQNGGGIYSDDSFVTINNSQINDNAAQNGAGIYSYEDSSFVMNNVTIDGNSSNFMGGGVFVNYSNVKLNNTIIVSNESTAYAGGFYSSHSHIIIDNSQISNNKSERGGGIYSDYDSSYVLNNVSIISNEANLWGGGLALSQFSGPSESNAEFTNITFAKNKAPQKTALYSYESNFIATNLTIASNEGIETIFLAKDSGTSKSYDMFFINTILWFNDNSGIQFDIQDVNSEIIYSNIQGGYNGTGNINSDPKFVDLTGGDYFLQPTSPSIDTGHPDLDGDGETWETDTDDQDPDGTRMDMGSAWFSQIESEPPTIQITNINDDTKFGSGNSQTIEWTATDNFRINWTKLFLKAPDSTSFTLLDSLYGNPGTYDYQVPLIVSKDYYMKISVSDPSGNTAADTQRFEVIDATLPVITLFKPNPGLQILEYETLDIEWAITENHLLDSTWIYYSVDNLVNLIAVDSLKSDSLKYKYKIPAGVTKQAKIKIVSTDSTGNKGNIESGAFEVVDNTKPTIAWNELSNKILKIANSVNLEWTSTDNVGVEGVDIAYSKDQSTWVEVAKQITNQNNYNWQIVNDPSTTVQFRVIGFDAVGLSDTSTMSGYTIKESYPQITSTDASNVIDWKTKEIKMVFDQSLDANSISTSNFSITSKQNDTQLPSFTYDDNTKSITLKFDNGFISKDSLGITVSGGIKSIYGYLFDGDGDETPGGNYAFSFESSLLGDYNYDTKIDGIDLAVLLNALESNDTEDELGPVEGSPPYFRTLTDGKLDIEDVMAFVMVWNWRKQNPNGSPNEWITSGQEADVSFSHDNISFKTMDQAFLYELEIKFISGQFEVVSNQLPNALLKYYDKVSNTVYLTSEVEQDEIKIPFNFSDRYGTVQFSYRLLDETGNSISQGSVLETIENIPNAFALHENYPNPFNPTTTIRFDIPEVTNVILTVFNLLGQKVKTFDYQDISPGYHSLIWDATNDLGEPVGAGVYLYQLQAKDFVKTRKMVLLK